MASSVQSLPMPPPMAQGISMELMPDIVPMSPIANGEYSLSSASNASHFSSVLGADDKGSIRAKRISKAKGLHRSDSDKSNKSNKSAMSFMNYDPKNEGSLARDTEVTLSMYDVYDDSDMATGINGDAQLQKPGSSRQTEDFSDGLSGTSGTSRPEEGRRFSQTSQSSAKAQERQNAGAAQGDTGPSVTLLSSGSIKQNGHDSLREPSLPGKSQYSVLSTTTTSQVRETMTSEMSSAPETVAKMSNGVMGDAVTANGETEVKDRNSLGRGSHLISPPRGFEDDKNDTDSIKTSGGTTTSSATSTLNRQGTSERTGSAVKKAGSFTMKAAYELSAPRNEPVTALPDTQFKTNLEDSITRRIAKAKQEVILQVQQQNGIAGNDPPGGDAPADDRALSSSRSSSRTSSQRYVSSMSTPPAPDPGPLTGHDKEEVIDNQQVADDILSVTRGLDSPQPDSPGGQDAGHVTNETASPETSAYKTGITELSSERDLGLKTTPGLSDFGGNTGSRRASSTTDQVLNDLPDRGSTTAGRKDSNASKCSRSSSRISLSSSGTSSVTLTRSLSAASDSTDSNVGNYDFGTEDIVTTLPTKPVEAPFERDAIPGGSMKRSISQASNISKTSVSSEHSKSGKGDIVTSIKTTSVQRTGSQISNTSEQSRGSGRRILPKSSPSAQDGALSRSESHGSDKSSHSKLSVTSGQSSGRIKPKDSSTSGSGLSSNSSTLERVSTLGNSSVSLSRSSSESSNKTGLSLPRADELQAPPGGADDNWRDFSTTSALVTTEAPLSNTSTPSANVSRNSSQKSKSGLSIPKKLPDWSTGAGLTRNTSHKSTTSQNDTSSHVAVTARTGTDLSTEARRKTSQISINSHTSLDKAAYRGDLSPPEAEVRRVETQSYTHSRSPAISRTSSNSSRKELSLFNGVNEGISVQRVDSQRSQASGTSQGNSSIREDTPSSNTSTLRSTREDTPTSNTSTLRSTREDTPTSNTSTLRSTREDTPTSNTSTLRSTREDTPTSNTSTLKSTKSGSFQFKSSAHEDTPVAVAVERTEYTVSKSPVVTRTNSNSGNRHLTLPKSDMEHISNSASSTLKSTKSTGETPESHEKPESPLPGPSSQDDNTLQGITTVTTTSTTTTKTVPVLKVETTSYKSSRQTTSSAGSYSGPKPVTSETELNLNSSTKTDLLERDSKANTDQNSIVKDSQFRSEVSKLFGGAQTEPVSPPWSQKKNTSGLKSKFKEYDINFDPSKTTVYSTQNEAASELANIFASRRKQDKTEEAKTDDGVENGEAEVRSEDLVTNRPLSPHIEIKQTVIKGTVAKLAKDFKNVPLTGRVATLERPKEKDKSPSDQEGEKKFKFLVEGIDVPAQEGEGNVTDGGESLVASPDRPLSPLSPVSPLSPASPGDQYLSGSDDVESDSLRREKKKGFTYLLDQALAEEVKKRASDVTARKPHEALEVKVQEQRQRTEANHANEEVMTLREARARLHKQLAQRKADLAREHTSIPTVHLKDARSRTSRAEPPQTTSVKEETHVKTLTTKEEKEDDTEQVTTPTASAVPPAPPPPPPPLPPPLSPPAQTVTDMPGVSTSRKQQQKAKKSSSGKTKKSQDLGQLSPDSAYQSDASPGFDVKQLVKDNSHFQPPVQEILANHGVPSTMPPGQHQVYEAKQKYTQELKSSTKTYGPSTSQSNGRPEVKEVSQEQKLQYETSFKGGTGDARQATSSSNGINMIANGTVPSLTERGEGGASMGRTSGATDVREHQIKVERNAPGLSNGHMSAEAAAGNSARISTEGAGGVHLTTGETTSLRSVSDVSDFHSTRSAPAAHGHLSLPPEQTSTLRSTHLSSSTQNNLYNGGRSDTLNSQGKKTAKVIPLKPLSIDVSHSNNFTQLKTHPATGVSPGGGGGGGYPSGVTSPTVKHVQGMFEMAEMTGGSYQQQRNYDNTYSTYRTEGPRYLDSGDYGQGYSGDYSHSYSGDYGRGVKNSSYDTLGSRHTSSGMNRTSDDVFTSFENSTLGRPSRSRYIRVDESRGGRLPVYGDRDIQIRDLEGYQYQSGRRYPGRHVSRVHLEGDPYDFDNQSMYSEPYDLDERGHSRGRYRHRRKHSGNSKKFLIRRSRSQPGLNRVSGPPIQFNVTSNVQPGSRDATMRSGQYNSWRSVGDDSTLRSGQYNSLGSNYNTYVAPTVTQSPIPADMDPSLDNVQGQTGNYHITLKLKDPLLNTLKQSRTNLEHSNSFHSSHGRSTRQSNYTSSVSVPDYEMIELESLRDEMDGVGSFPMVNTTTTSSVNRTDSDRRRWIGRVGEEQNLDIEVVGQGNRMAYDTMTRGGDTQFTSTQYVKLSPSGNQPPRHRFDGPEPAFSMAVNQTLTMDYAPKEQREDSERLYKIASVQKSPPKSGPAFPKFKPQTTSLITPRDNEDDEDFPQVVRGSILIKNRIDTTGPAVVKDYVVQDESDDDDNFVVDDNTNLFHTRYFQSRENPVYSSNEDLSDPRIYQERRPAFTQIFRQEEEGVEIPVNIRNGKEPKKTKPAFKVPVGTTSLITPRKEENGLDELDEGGLYEEGFDETTTRTTTTREFEKPRAKTSTTQLDIARFLRNAPPGSVKQSINVEREEEDIIGPLPMKHADGTATGPEGLLNFDTVSEKVDIGVLNGVAQLAVKVRCERIVPIRGVEDMFKKSSVIVTRLIEIDLEATDERRSLYEHIMRGGSGKAMIEDSSGGSRSYGAAKKLSTKDTFKLYKTFMGIAEADDGQGMGAKTKIDKRIEDQRAPPRDEGFTYGNKERERMQYQLDKEEENAMEQDGLFSDEADGENAGFDLEELDRRLEEQMPSEDRTVLEEIRPGSGSKLMKPQEPDAVSFMSHATEGTSDIIF